MPEIDSHRLGNFCWIELATPGEEGAKSFYGSLFGWTANGFPMGDGSAIPGAGRFSVPADLRGALLSFFEPQNAA